MNHTWRTPRHLRCLRANTAKALPAGTHLNHAVNQWFLQNRWVEAAHGCLLHHSQRLLAAAREGRGVADWVVVKSWPAPGQTCT